MTRAKRRRPSFALVWAACRAHAAAAATFSFVNAHARARARALAVSTESAKVAPTAGFFKIRFGVERQFFFFSHIRFVSRQAGGTNFLSVALVLGCKRSFACALLRVVFFSFAIFYLNNRRKKIYMTTRRANVWPLRTRKKEQKTGATPICAHDFSRKKKLALTRIKWPLIFDDARTRAIFANVTFISSRTQQNFFE